MVLYSWWPFTQQLKFILIEDKHFAADSTNDPPVLEVAHNPNRRLSSGPYHVSDFLSGKGKGKPKLCREHKQYTGQALFNSLSSKVSEAVLGIPEPSPQNADNSQNYLGAMGKER